MTTRTTMRTNAMPGGRIEYPGDLPPPTSTYAMAIDSSELGRRMRIVASTMRTGAAVVSRRWRRGKHGLFHFVYSGGRPMKPPVPTGPAYGSVVNSPFQRIEVHRTPWHINPSWHEAGYPLNLGLSQRTLQPQTSVYGGPGSAHMGSKPLYSRVQQIPKARAQIQVYQTRGQGAKK